MASPISPNFDVAKEQYLIKIKNRLSTEQKRVMRTQIKRGLVWAAMSLWPLLFPGIRDFLLGVIILLLFGLGIPIRSILNVENGFGKLNKFAEELVNQGEIHDAIIESRLEEYQTEHLVASIAAINGKKLGIWSSKSCQENDTIKVLYQKNYPGKALPIDHIENGEINPIFYFDEEAAGLIVPTTDDFSGATP